jgi:glycolate oxidase iron-sulfur subunit
VETRLLPEFLATPAGQEADAILRSCVHCGFCNATCPTYQLLGDELDGPRGRIYQIKAVLEGAPATRSAQVHLDRCLTCRACETTCPSGVRYGRLLDIGREVVDAAVARPPAERLARALLREGISRRWLFGAGVSLARRLRALLPAALARKIPARRGGDADVPVHPAATGRVLFLTHCSQDALLPSVDRAAMRVLARLGVSVVRASEGGCCGALRAHLSDAEGARAAARRNIDAWWPHVESGVEALVMTASGCGVQVRDYGRLLEDDRDYATRAARIAALTRDLSEWLAPRVDELRGRVGAAPARVAFHAPCTLQHGQRLGGVVEGMLAVLGAELVPVADAHLCCGSAGSYSLLQPALANALRTRKLAALMASRPEVILSANVGCLLHLEAESGIPVRHWIEWVDDRLGPDPARGTAAHS